MAPQDYVTPTSTQLPDGMVGCADFCNSNRMSEGRQSQVVLLDDRRLDILIKPKLYAGELLDMVSSHFSLKEKEYFGLAFLDETGHYSWLQLDRRILEHEFPKKSSQSTLMLYFRIKYFVESITYLRDSATVIAFYLQVRSLVYKGTIEVCSEKAFRLAALVLQETHGDYVDDETTRQQLKKLPVIPTSTLLEHPSLTVCEERIAEQYKALKGQSRGSAVVSYMHLVESVPTYGVHYYEVKDKNSIPWWLGISFKGICQYDQTDKKIPRKVFLWKQLENLYFRDRKFSIEVHDPKRLGGTRRTFGHGNISVHVWFAHTPSLTKCIWSMAIAQHQFYLDRKHNKSPLSPARSLTEIAADLSQSFHSLSSETPSLSRSASSLSLPALKIESDSCEESNLEVFEMFVSLKARKEALEEALHRKTEELKKLCLQEGELTGALPPEMPLTPGEQIPVIQRKIGKAFSSNDNLIWKEKSKEDEELCRLEFEYEIQKKITSATLKLANDLSAKKNCRRQRKIAYQKAHSKLKDIEKKLSALKVQVESSKKDHLRHYSDDEPSEENTSHSTDDNDTSLQDPASNLADLSITLSPQEAPVIDDSHCAEKSLLHTPLSPSLVTSVLRSMNSSSAPPSPSKPRHILAVQRPGMDHSSSSQRSSMIRTDPALGYTPSSVYQTRTSYRSQQYPTLPTRSPTSPSSVSETEYTERVINYNLCDNSNTVLNLMSPYQNRFESTLDIEGSNLYSVPTQRTSQAFDSQDDTLASIPPNFQDLGLMSRHNSLDRPRRQNYQRYRRYIESTLSPVEMLRSSSIQTSASYDERLSYNQIITEADVHSSQTLMHCSAMHSPSSVYSVHHPHHFHHHRHKHVMHPHERTYGINNKAGIYDEHCDTNWHSQTKVNEETYGLKTSRERLIIEEDFVPDTSQSFGGNENQAFLKCDTYAGPQARLIGHDVHSGREKSDFHPKKSKSWMETSPDEAGFHHRFKEKKPSWCDSDSSLSSPDLLGSSRSASTQFPCRTKHSAATSEPTSPASKGTLTLNHTSKNSSISVVSYGHFQPYWEETKPYETSDFYKYSTKHRKQHQDACQNLHAKLSAWKVSQSSTSHHGLAPVMSPVMERSRATSPAWSFLNGERGETYSAAGDNLDVGEGTSSDTKSFEVELPPSSSSDVGIPVAESSSRAPNNDSFPGEMKDWYLKQDKPKKTTLV